MNYQNPDAHQIALTGTIVGEDTSAFKDRAEMSIVTGRRGISFVSEAIANFTPFEWVTFAYLAWIELILILFHRNTEHASRYVTIHLAIAMCIVLLVGTAAHSRKSVLCFARHWYPLPLYIFFFEELQGLVHMVFPYIFIVRWFSKKLQDCSH